MVKEIAGTILQVMDCGFENITGLPATDSNWLAVTIILGCSLMAGGKFSEFVLLNNQSGRTCRKY